MKKGAGDSKSDAPPEPSSFIANRSSLGKRCDGDNLFYHSSAERALTKGMGASFNRATQSTPGGGLLRGRLWMLHVRSR
jgi:hypothetical protein